MVELAGVASAHAGGWIMEHNLDNRVVLSTEREHKILYSWSIKEFDEKGKQIGRDHIPWDWGLRFEVIELNPSYSLQMKEGDVSGEEGSQPSEVSEYLYGKLLPSVESRKAGNLLDVWDPTTN
jgi:hypothetical protein